MPAARLRDTGGRGLPQEGVGGRARTLPLTLILTLALGLTLMPTLTLNLNLNLTLTLTLILALPLPLPLPLTLTLTLIRVRRVQRGVADLQLQPIDLGVLDGLLRARLEQLRARLLLLLVLRLELLARLLKQLQ